MNADEKALRLRAWQWYGWAENVLFHEDEPPFPTEADEAAAYQRGLKGWEPPCACGSGSSRSGETAKQERTAGDAVDG